MGQATWTLVVPVKRLADAKTRLRPATAGTPVPHRRLVLALALDTVRAVLECPVVTDVLVVTADPLAARALGSVGAQLIAEPPASGLNQAAAYAVTQLPAGRPVAVLPADLPALRPAELAAALHEVISTPSQYGGDWHNPAARCFVPDAAGAGTTLLAAPAGVALEPQFGPESAARHAAAGARRLAGDWPGLRRDVDTAADLLEADRLGLGEHTAELWPAVRPRRYAPPQSPGSAPAPGPGRAAAGGA